MKQIDLDYLVIVALFLSGLYVATTGLLTDLLGAPQFFWHSYAGYVSAILVGTHLALHWGRIVAYLRRRFKGSSRRASSTQRERAALTGRRSFLAALLAGLGGFTLGWLFPTRRPATLPAEVGDVGAFYHQWSKPSYAMALGGLFSWGGQPEQSKTYAQAKRVALPNPRGHQGLSLEDAIKQRRSRREYKAEPLSLEELSRLLHAAGGVTDPARGYRAAPSAGALYPIEIYIVVNNVAGLEPGAYHYAVSDHTLEYLRTGDLRAQMVVAGIGQEILGEAGVCFVLSAVFQRTRWKYRERAYRYVLLEAGHIGQNFYLAAASMGLGACAVGAFLDDKLNDLLGLDGEKEAVLYIITMGKV